MALTKISVIRRRELRKAAFAVMQRDGVAGTTLEKVAQEAGASKGIVLHYFRNKQHLFEEAMREANAELRDLVIAKMRQTNTPYDRVWAIIEANLCADFYRPEYGRAWLSLCAEAPAEPSFARLQRVIHARMHSNLLSGLRHMVPGQQADRAAYAISALIDGLWVRLGLGDPTISSELALELARDLLVGQQSLADRKDSLPDNRSMIGET